MTLPHQLVAPASPARWGLVLHGILGTKTNWRGVIRRVSQSLPTWGFVLPDLRNHGDARGFTAPHTLDAVCDDLVALGASLGHGFDAVIGHSYGGKAALAYTARVAGALDRTVVVDSNPGARPDLRGAEATVLAVETFAALADVAFEAREDFAAAVMARGFTRDVALWMGMNLGHDPDGAYRLRTDVGAVRAMLDDYFARDLWDVIENPPGRVRVHMLLGGRSRSTDASERVRVLRAVARDPTRVCCDVVESAGHWVHVDAPDETVRIVTAALGDVG